MYVYYLYLYIHLIYVDWKHKRKYIVRYLQKRVKGYKVYTRVIIQKIYIAIKAILNGVPWKSRRLLLRIWISTCFCILNSLKIHKNSSSKMWSICISDTFSHECLLWLPLSIFLVLNKCLTTYTFYIHKLSSSTLYIH